MLTREGMLCYIFLFIAVTTCCDREDIYPNQSIFFRVSGGEIAPKKLNLPRKTVLSILRKVIGVYFFTAKLKRKSFNFI